MYFRSNEDVRACDDVRTELMPFVQSQYAGSSRMVSILEGCRGHILPDADIALFYDMEFNVKTAQGKGLDAWGHIVGVERTIPEMELDEYGDIVPTGNTITLADESYRKLILHKAASNIMDSTLASMNYLLKKLYTEHTCYVQLASQYSESGGIYIDNNPMEIVYFFNGETLTPTELSVFAYIGDYNRGAGVGWNFNEFKTDAIFGFYGSLLQPFDQGVFVFG